MNTPFVMYKNKKTDLTLDHKYMTSYHKNTQLVELKILVDLIEDLYLKKGRGLKILDVGVGDGRIPLALGMNGLFEKIDFYVGVENSQIQIQRAIRNIEDSKLDHNVKIIYLDALNLESEKFKLPEQKYDLIICTYFTPVNFKPDEIQIETNKNGKIVPYSKESLKLNKNFIKVFKTSYEMLSTNGKIFLGSIYIDTDENRKRQEDFYRKCGMTVITSPRDEFTATKEGFWSERFTKKKVYRYFSFVPREKIKLISLDNYNFAWSVIVSR